MVKFLFKFSCIAVAAIVYQTMFGVCDAGASPLRLAPELSIQAGAQDAVVLEPTHVLVGFSAGGFAAKSFLYDNDRHGYVRSNLTLAYGIRPGWQARLDIGHARSRNTRTIPEKLSAFGDSRLAVRLAKEVMTGLELGIEPAFLFYAPVPGVSGLFDGTSISIRQMAAYTKGAFRGIFNTGFVIDRSANVVGGDPTASESAAFGLGTYNYFLLALRPQASFGRFEPYGDLNLNFPVAASIRASEGNKSAALGVAIEAMDDLVFDTHLRFALDTPDHRGTPRLAPWQIGASAAYRIDGKSMYTAIRSRIVIEPSYVQVSAFDLMRRVDLRQAEIRIYTPDRVVAGKGNAYWSGIASSVTYALSAQYHEPVTGVIPLTQGLRVTEAVGLIPTHGMVRGIVASTDVVDRATFVTIQAGNAVSHPVEGPFLLALPPGQYTGYFEAFENRSRRIEFTVSLERMLNLGHFDLSKTYTPPSQAELLDDELFFMGDTELPKPSDSVIQDVRSELRAGQSVQHSAQQKKTLPAASRLAVNEQQAPGVGSFAVGATALTQAEKRELAALAKTINTDPGIAFVVVEGSADDTGTPATNARLARMRAYQVYNELRRNGVPEDKMAVKVGYFARGIESASSEQRAKQRRVSVQVIRND